MRLPIAAHALVADPKIAIAKLTQRDQVLGWVSLVTQTLQRGIDGLTVLNAIDALCMGQRQRADTQRCQKNITKIHKLCARLDQSVVTH
jgi:hypothetical protein